MQITFLGTGTSQGVPVIGCTHEVCLSKDSRDQRMRTAAAISLENHQYIIDCGPDFRQQMIQNDIRDIDGILLTHHHADHTAGIDDVRPFSLKYGEVPIYAKKDVVANIKDRFGYIFETVNKYHGAPNLKVNLIDSTPFILGGVEVEPLAITHGKIDILGFRFGKLAYITDASHIAKNTMNKLMDLEVLVLNALRIEPHPTHFNLQQALGIIKQLKPKRAYLTHISHKLGFHEEVSKVLPKHVFLAYDGLSVTI